MLGEVIGCHVVPPSSVRQLMHRRWVSLVQSSQLGSLMFTVCASNAKNEVGAGVCTVCHVAPPSVVRTNAETQELSPHVLPAAQPTCSSTKCSRPSGTPRTTSCHDLPASSLRNRAWSG